MRSWSSSTTSLVLVLVVVVLSVAACGGKPWQPRFEGPTGFGKDAYWVMRAHGRPKAVVVVLHGLARDPRLQLRRWQEHLADEGYDVIFPEYEDPPPDANARNNVVGAVGRALGTLGRPEVPLVLLGHSRGGRLAVEAAAYLQPRAVIAFYPGLRNPSFEPDTNLALISKTTDIYLLVGDRDTGVGTVGARELDQRLLRAGFPESRIHGGIVRSATGFTADHESVYTLTDAGKRAVWGRADRLIANAIR